MDAKKKEYSFTFEVFLCVVADVSTISGLFVTER